MTSLRQQRATSAVEIGTNPLYPFFRRRFDHVLASRSLWPVECHYLHPMREADLSNPSPLTVLFDPCPVPVPVPSGW